MRPNKKSLKAGAALVVATLVALHQGHPPAAAAEDARPDTPEAVVRLYISGLASGDHELVAGLMDPESLERLRDMLLPLLLDMPTEEGEPGGLSLLAGVATPEEARTLTGAAFFKAFFSGISNLNPAFATALKSTTGEIVGSVPEGEGTVHVVCRSHMSVDSTSVTKMLVVSLKSVEGRWRVLLSGEIEGMAQSIKRALAQKSGQLP